MTWQYAVARIPNLGCLLGMDGVCGDWSDSEICETSLLFFLPPNHRAQISVIIFFNMWLCCSLLRHLMYRVRGILSWVNCFIACMDIYLNLPIHVTGTRWGYQFHSWRYKYICTLNWDMQLRAKHHQRFGAVVFIKWLICVTCLFIYPLTLAQTFVLQWFSTHPQSLGTL